MMPEQPKRNEAHIIVQDLTMAYGSFVVQRDLTFTVNRGDIFIIMGGSGCGKSTLLRHMIGLKAPSARTHMSGGLQTRFRLSLKDPRL